MSPETGKIIPHAKQAGEHRSSIATRDLKRWLSRVGLPYHSPHKFRHGNAVYSLKQARNVPELKAISQNLMHSNLNITDGVYGILSDSDTKSFIAKLGNKSLADQLENIDTIKEILKQAVKELEGSRPSPSKRSET
jgi:integrase